MDDRPPLVVIVGPTAAGKTEIAMQLAQRLGGEIISADSRTFYRGLDIGTAKPSLEERISIPHHLVDCAEPGESWSLSNFQAAVKAAIHSIRERQNLPILVGGTGQYVWAVLRGWSAPPVAPVPALRQALTSWAGEIGSQGLYDRLTVLDPQAAAKIDHRNLRRTVRALEVILTTGRLFSAQQGSGPPPYNTLVLGLSRPRAELYARIDARIEAMIQAGWVDEVRALLARGLVPTLPAFSAIGYREIIDYIQGQSTLSEAILLIKRNTRVFVRRQANWFKPDDPQIHWFDCSPNTVDLMEKAIQSFLHR